MRPITYGIVQAGENTPDGVPYIRPVDMTDDDGVRDAAGLLRTSPEIARAYERSEVRAGDIVISIGPSYGKTMLVPQELSGANLTQGTARIAVDRRNYAPYVRWALRSAVASASWDAAVGGATFRALNLEPLSGTPIPHWPLPLQRSIAAYLDRETARIDALIAGHNHLMDLLEQRKGSVREHAVVSARDSSPPLRLGRLAKEVDARLGTAEPPTLLSVSIHRGVVPFAEANPEREPRADGLANYKRCQAGDLVLNRMRAFQGGIGCSPQPGIVSPDYAVLRPMPDVSPQYLFHLMRSPWFVGQMEARLRGIGSSDQGNVRTPRVNWSDLKVIPVPRPAEEEQETIASRVANELHGTTAAQEAIARQVALLDERRVAMITAAVTGELELPEAA